MAVFGSRVWFRFTCCLVLTVLPVSVGLSQTSGSDTPEFTNVVIPAGGDPYAVAVADVNHDGSMDIIAANPEHGTVSVLLGDRRGHFRHSPGSPIAAGHLPSDIAIGDLNATVTRIS
jgi:hypothetical protein